jgi:hypothetical protein
LLEKVIPPSLIRRLGRRAGFQRIVIHPSVDRIAEVLISGPAAGQKGLMRWKKLWPFNYLSAVAMIMFMKRWFGIVVLYK